MVRNPLVVEVVLRVALAATGFLLEDVRPFHRVIRHEELLMYRHPHIPDTIPFGLLVVLSLGIPLAFFAVHYLASRDKADLIHGVLGLTLAASLLWLVINILKISIGRPRPDFYHRCFPTEPLEGREEAQYCTGNTKDVEQGLKSFPSGHSGCIFSCFGFLSLYLTGKLRCFRSPGSGQGWRLCAVLAPLLAATMVGISRIQSHKHHWEDVVVGGIIGLTSAVLCYYQYFPSPFSSGGDSPYPSLMDPQYTSPLLVPSTDGRTKAVTRKMKFSGSDRDRSSDLESALIL